MQVAPRLGGGGGTWQRCRLLPLLALAANRQQQASRRRRVRQSTVQAEQRQQQHEQQPEQHAGVSGSGSEAPAATVAAAAAAAGLVGARPGSSASDAVAPPAEVPLPTSSSMDVAVAGAAPTTSSSSSAGGTGTKGSTISGSSSPEEKDEPELALVLMACGIGLATGAAIVGFNVGVHEIRDWIWHDQPLLSSSREVLRGIAESELWPRVVFPPFLGGLAVGALGLLIGGYDDLPPPRVGDASNGGAAAKQQGAAGSGSGGGSGSSGSLSGSASVLGSMSVSGSGTAAAAAAPSSSLALEQWKLQAVLRPVSRALAAVMTLGSGASLGPEGPSVDIGKSFAKGFASSLRSRQRHLTSFIAAGAGAGVAAGFNAPVAGVFFAVETVLQKQKLPRAPSGGDLQQQVSSTVSSLQPSGLTVAMVLLASVLAAVVSQAGLGSSPAFRVPEYRLESLAELPLYLAFGAICGVVSASFSFSTRVATDAFDELRQQNRLEAALMPCIGGLTTGVLALGYPEILYQGFDNVNNILSSNGAYAPGLLIQIVVMKVIATSICRGSGLQGGLYAPSIFIGAALGTAFGLMAHAVGDPLGMTLAAPQAYALVGVAAMLASNCSVPLTSVLLLFELTRDYLIILPTMAAVGISFWISSLAAPSVKNAAAARRMSAAAAASAAVATTQLNPKATEAILVGSLQQQGKLSSKADIGQQAAGSTAAAHQPTAHQQGGTPAAAAAAYAGEQPRNGAASPAGFGAGSDASFDGFDAPSAAAAAVAAKLGALPGPVQLAAEAARGGQELLVAAALERSCLLVEAEMPVARALALMEADDQHVAVVLGEDGGVMGLVTRDVLEQCVEAAEAEAAAAASSSSSASSSSDGEGGSSGSGSSRRSRAAAKARDVAMRAEAEGPAAPGPAAAATGAAAGKAAAAALAPPAAPLRSVSQE